MNYFTLFPMHGYWGKWAGALLAALALIAVIVDHLTGQVIARDLMSPHLRLHALLWIYALGLFSMTFSKEKVDDERVKQVRYTAFRGTYMLTITMALILFFPLFWSTNFSIWQDPQAGVMAISILPALPLTIYQVLFHIGLRQDPDWAYTDLSAEENIKRHPRSVLIWMLIGVLVLVSLLILRSIMG